jgi:bifunctional DNase/RNase
MDTPKMIESKVTGLALDITTNSPVLTIQPIDSEKVLPIWIGHYEAWAISMEISGMSSKRPLTHDLLFSMITSLNGKVDKVEIVDLESQTFFAKIIISINGESVSVDSRPSDSIALALKAKAPIFVNEKLYNLKNEQLKSSGLPDSESLRDRLRKINPEDFGNYKL